MVQLHSLVSGNWASGNTTVPTPVSANVPIVYFDIIGFSCVWTLKAESEGTWLSSFLLLWSLCSSASNRLAGFLTLTGSSGSYSMQTLAVPLALLASSGFKQSQQVVDHGSLVFTVQFQCCDCTHWMSSSSSWAGGCPTLWRHWRCESLEEVRSKLGHRVDYLATRWSLLEPSSQLASVTLQINCYNWYNLQW